MVESIRNYTFWSDSIQSRFSVRLCVCVQVHRTDLLLHGRWLLFQHSNLLLFEWCLNQKWLLLHFRPIRLHFEDTLATLRAFTICSVIYFNFNLPFCGQLCSFSRDHVCLTISLGFPFIFPFSIWPPPPPTSNGFFWLVLGPTLEAPALFYSLLLVPHTLLFVFYLYSGLRVKSFWYKKKNEKFLLCIHVLRLAHWLRCHISSWLPLIQLLITIRF